MSTRLFAIALLLTGSTAFAASPSVLLGFDYSEWVPTTALRIATDKTGAIYILTGAAGISSNTPPSTVTKLSSDGKTIVWQNQLGIAVGSMAVDPNGGVYVTPVNLGTPVTVAKLNDTGIGLAWTQSAGFTMPFGFLPVLAADATGRSYVAGFGPSSRTTLVRLNASGTAVDYTTQLDGMPASIAADATGAANLISAFSTGLTLSHIATDGTVTYQNLFKLAGTSPTIALDPNGNAVVYSAGVVTRFDSAGMIASSATVIPSGAAAYPSFALDAAGNAYALGVTNSTYYPAKNTLAPCNSEFLTVAAPDGSILQTTYIPGAISNGQALVTVSSNGSVLLIEDSLPTTAPTRLLPFADAGSTAVGNVLIQLSPNPNAAVLPLACTVNGATFRFGSISPGELITLFGNGLGPTNGAIANVQATLPTQLGDVQVTFDGKASPLIWAQDAQINAVVPSSLPTGRNTQVCVTRASVNLNCLSLPVDQVTPGVFTYDGTHAVALNQDGTVNSAANPAAKGSLVSVFATGVGPINPGQPDGSITSLPLPGNTLQITAWELVAQGGPSPAVTQVPAQVTYAGPAPYRVAGISQINLRLSTTSNSYVIKVGDVQSLPFIVYY